MLIRYYGPVGIPSGYGHAANEMCMAMLSAGVTLEILTYSPSSDPQNYLHQRYLPLAPCIRHEEAPPTPDPDVVIVHTLPSDCLRVLGASRVRELHPRALCVAYTTWEGASPLSLVDCGLHGFDEVWTPNRVELGDAPVSDTGRRRPIRHRVVPHAYDDSVDWTEDRQASSPTDPFRFYYIGAWTRRKNPEGVVQAYLRAFSRRDRVQLVMHCQGAGPDAAKICAIASAGRRLEELPEIMLHTAWLPDNHVQGFHDTCDCFVTATRGEAWNLPAFDAMLARRHIISPGRLGSDEYLSGTSAWFCRSRLAPAGGDVQIVDTPKGPGMRVVGGMTCKDDWRDPDIAELSVLMRRAYCERVSTLDVHYDPAARFGRAAVGTLIRTQLEGVIR